MYLYKDNKLSLKLFLKLKSFQRPRSDEVLAKNQHLGLLSEPKNVEQSIENLRLNLTKERKKWAWSHECSSQVYKKTFLKDNLFLYKTYTAFKKRLKQIPMFKSFSLWRMKMLTKTRNYTSEELYSIEILLLEEKASALKIKTEPGCRRKAIKSDCISCKAQRRFFLFQICFRLCWKHQEIYSKFLWRKSAK